MTPKQIRNLRLFMRLTQKEFASVVDTTTATVSNWETGKFIPRRMSLKVLKQVAQKAKFHTTVE